MDPLTISALIGIAPTLIGMDWDQLFNGDKFSKEGWHGWSSEVKNDFVKQTVNFAFLSATEKGYKGYSPKQIFWTILLPYIHRPDSKTFDSWFSKNKHYQAVFDEAAASFGFPFDQPAPQNAALKKKVVETLKNPIVLYGIGALALLWILVIILKTSKGKK